MMPSVEVAPRKWIALPVFAATVFVFQIQFGQTAPLTAFMAAIGALAVYTSMTLRDAEFMARKACSGVSRKDVFSYGCAVLFDTALLLGLMAGAGLWTSTERFASLVLLVGIPVVIATWWSARNNRAQEPDTEIRFRHWNGPLILVLGAGAVWFTGGVQAPSGSQIFVFLVLLSVNMASLDLQSPFTGTARMARFAVLGLTLVLLLWNYGQLT